jgi:hypothetical protein
MRPNPDQIIFFYINTHDCYDELCGYCSLANSLRFQDPTTRHGVYRKILLDDEKVKQLYEEILTDENIAYKMQLEEIRDAFLENPDNHHRLGINIELMLNEMQRWGHQDITISTIFANEELKKEAIDRYCEYKFYEKTKLPYSIDEVSALQKDYEEAKITGNFLEKLDQADYEIDQSTSGQPTKITPSYYQKLVAKEIFKESEKFRMAVEQKILDFGHAEQMNYEKNVDAQVLKLYSTELDRSLELTIHDPKRPHISSTKIQEDFEKNNGTKRIFTYNPRGGHYSSIVSSLDIERYQQEIIHRSDRAIALDQPPALPIDISEIPDTIIPPPPREIFNFKPQYEGDAQFKSEVLTDTISNLLNTIKDSKLADDLKIGETLPIDQDNFFKIENIGGKEQIFIKYDNTASIEKRDDYSQAQDQAQAEPQDQAQAKPLQFSFSLTQPKISNNLREIGSFTIYFLDITKAFEKKIKLMPPNTTTHQREGDIPRANGGDGPARTFGGSRGDEHRGSGAGSFRGYV